MTLFAIHRDGSGVYYLGPELNLRAQDDVCCRIAGVHVKIVLTYIDSNDPPDDWAGQLCAIA